MEASMFSINNLRMMEVIDISTGSKLGYIKDFKIDCDEKRVVALVLPPLKSSWFGKSENIEVPWDKVRKIGIDVILVDADKLLIFDKE